MPRIVIVVLLACCTPGPAHQQPPKPTPKGTPLEVSEEQRAAVRESMWALSWAVRELDSELAEHDDDDDDLAKTEAQKIAEILQITRDLDAQQVAVEHPMLGPKLDVFIAQLDFLQQQAEKDEAKVAGANAIVAQCSTCHDVRACPFDSYATCVDVEKAPSAP